MCLILTEANFSDRVECGKLDWHQSARFDISFIFSTRNPEEEKESQIYDVKKGVFMKLSKIFFPFVFIPAFLSAQVDTAWVRRYNGPGNGDDVARAMATDGLGNLYVTGYSFGSTTGYDYATIKYSPQGDSIWVSRYNHWGRSRDAAYAIAVDPQGNVYVTGGSRNFGTGSDVATIKYQHQGAREWVARYNSPRNSDEEGWAITFDDSGNVYIAGFSYDSTNSPEYLTVKYNSLGGEQWVAEYNNGFGDDGAYGIVVDRAGNVYVTGYSFSTESNDDYVTIKYDSEGRVEWLRRYNGPNNGYDGARAIAIDDSGNVYVTGRSEGDYATIKYSPTGEERWVARYNGLGNGDDYAYAIAVDQDGNVYVTGYSEGSATYYDYATVKYNPSGEEQWVARYNGLGNGNDFAYALALDQLGNVYVTGTSYGFDTSNDFATIKYGPDGQEKWVALYDGTGNNDDRAYAISVDSAGNVYVTGESYGFGTGLDYATIKYVPTPTGTEEMATNSAPHGFLAYPNPAKTNLAIRLGVNSKNLNLRIYDVAGVLVKEIPAYHSGLGNNNQPEIKISLKGINPGVYILRVKTENNEFAQKLIVQ